MTSSRGGPCQPLREKVVRSFEACTRPPIELQPPTSTPRRRRGQRRGVPRSWGLLSAQNSARSSGPTQPAERELSDFDAPEAPKPLSRSPRSWGLFLATSSAKRAVARTSPPKASFNATKRTHKWRKQRIALFRPLCRWFRRRGVPVNLRTKRLCGASRRALAPHRAPTPNLDAPKASRSEARSPPLAGTPLDPELRTELRAREPAECGFAAWGPPALPTRPWPLQPPAPSRKQAPGPGPENPQLPRTPPGHAHLRRHALEDARARARQNRRARWAVTNGTTSQPSKPPSLSRGCPGGRSGPNEMHARPNRRAPGRAHFRKRALEMQSAQKVAESKWRRRPPPKQESLSGNTECSRCPIATPSPNGARGATEREHRRHEFTFTKSVQHATQTHAATCNPYKRPT